MTTKNYLKDPDGVLKNWDQDSVDPCREAPSQNLCGLLSPSIGNLTNLEPVIVGNPLICGANTEKRLLRDCTNANVLQLKELTGYSTTGQN
ncbi:LRR receptor kinase SERL2-like [Phragmites australis]|uniref:LRR receptor kinase SERL2-like n=1 Tax=Phragmites australis TaxID=29695 RepID=UPI002D787360|nr:LRR receptor kinase SERL2-like [Phragmites australis]